MDCTCGGLGCAKCMPLDDAMTSEVPVPAEVLAALASPDDDAHDLEAVLMNGLDQGGPAVRSDTEEVGIELMPFDVDLPAVDWAAGATTDKFRLDDILSSPEDVVLGDAADVVTSFVVSESQPKRVHVGVDVAALVEAHVVLRRSATPFEPSNLSPFERFVVEKIDGNRSNTAVARELGVSEGDLRIALALLVDKRLVERVAGPAAAFAPAPRIERAPTQAPMTGVGAPTKTPAPAPAPLPMPTMSWSSAPQAAPIPPLPTTRRSPTSAMPLPTSRPAPAPMPLPTPTPSTTTAVFELPELNMTPLPSVLADNGEPAQVRPSLRSPPRPPPGAAPAMARPPSTPAPVFPGRMPQGAVSLDGRHRAASLHAQCVRELKNGNIKAARELAEQAAVAAPDVGLHKDTLEQWDAFVQNHAVPDDARAEAQAIRAAELGDATRAIALLKQAVAQNPKNAPAWNRLAVMLATGERDFNAACDAAAKALELVPDDATYMSNFAKFAGIAERQSGGIDNKKRSMWQRMLKR